MLVVLLGNLNTTLIMLYLLLDNFYQYLFYSYWVSFMKIFFFEMSHLFRISSPIFLCLQVYSFWTTYTLILERNLEENETNMHSLVYHLKSLSLIFNILYCIHFVRCPNLFLEQIRMKYLCSHSINF